MQYTLVNTVNKDKGTDSVSALEPNVNDATMKKFVVVWLVNQKRLNQLRDHTSFMSGSINLTCKFPL